MSICELRMKLQASQSTQVRLQDARCYSRMINTAQNTGIMRRYASFIPHAEGPDTSGSLFFADRKYTTACVSVNTGQATTSSTAHFSAAASITVRGGR